MPLPLSARTATRYPRQTITPRTIALWRMLRYHRPRGYICKIRIPVLHLFILPRPLVLGRSITDAPPLLGAATRHHPRPVDITAILPFRKTANGCLWLMHLGCRARLGRTGAGACVGVGVEVKVEILVPVLGYRFAPGLGWPSSELRRMRHELPSHMSDTEVYRAKCQIQARNRRGECPEYLDEVISFRRVRMKRATQRRVSDDYGIQCHVKFRVKEATCDKPARCCMLQAVDMSTSDK